MARNLPSTDEHSDIKGRSPIVRVAGALADSSPFNVFIFGVILANAVVLGLETYDSIERDHGDLLGLLNNVFLGIFVVELVVRLTAYGSRPQDFFRNGWNIFDFVVVTASFLPGLRENAALLRLARLARVIRVVRLLPELRVFVVAIGKSLPGVVSLAVMTVLLLFLYGMAGWLLYGEELPDDYGNIGTAMLTMFILLSLENLPDSIHAGLEISNWTVPFFVSYVLFASLLVLNILIGVVMNSMDEARALEDKRDAEERSDHGRLTADDALADRIKELRSSLDDLERDLRGRGGGF